MIRVIHGALDASEECVGAFRDNRTPEPPAAALLAIEDLVGEPQRPPAAPADGPSLPVPASTAAAASQPAEMVRLPAENLDRLVRSTGLILMESLRQASVTGTLDALDFQIAEVTAECVRFRKASAAPCGGWRASRNTQP